MSSEQLLEQLRRDVVTGIFIAGEKLPIDALRQRYGAGLSPLREVLNRLAATGLIEQLPQRGFRVPALTRADLEDVASLRIELETRALRDALIHGDDHWLDEVMACLYRLKRTPLRPDADVEQWEMCHRAFHLALIGACPSPWRRRFVGVLYDQFDRYRRAAPERPDLRDTLDAHHEQLATLAERRQVEEAVALLERHIQLSFEVALDCLPHSA
ncbi:GntR family transcriptional regulator [Larsenimonas rhizosphaerae]|uniref:GntR family transcriptional regulator n=1 Tax=Larsenimonas rhizosphaerae TaxID=2944682 RepID=UPI00203496DD|nr:GntR family transcriptional regulator [Larsenimonas rhizosphaerae]MCM2129996.1 GntR family transcriptional regulator [Larsenimonas rhizosphaerae]